MSRQGWTMTIAGSEFRESDLTMAQATVAHERCGGTWPQLHPLTSPAHFIALGAAFLMGAGMSESEALLNLGRLRMVDALDMVTAGEKPDDVHAD